MNRALKIYHRIFWNCVAVSCLEFTTDEWIDYFRENNERYEKVKIDEWVAELMDDYETVDIDEAISITNDAIEMLRKYPSPNSVIENP
jgi:hypothetical protein